MSHKSLLTIVFFLLGSQLVLIGIAYFQFATRSPRQFFAAPLDESKPFQIIALERPNVSVKALLNWATLAATATFTFDFVNYKEQLAAIKDYFTVDGYNNFVAALKNNSTLSTIEEKKLVLSAVSIGPAIVLSEEELAGHHTWNIQIPLLVRYQSANVNEARYQIVSLVVTQVPTQNAPKGIGIAQYIAQGGGPELS
jgi:intracellular multiplication protein IcmL